MATLSPIAQYVRSNAQVAEQLKVKEIRTVLASIESGKQKVFTKSIEQARLLANAKGWFNSNNSLCKERGITWKSILSDLFGFTEASIESKWPNQLLKVGDVTNEQLEEFVKWAQDNDKSLSVKQLYLWMKGETEETTEGGEGEEQTAKAQCVCSWTFKLPLVGQGERNVSVSIDTEGVVKTASTEDELRLAYEMMGKALGLA